MRLPFGLGRGNSGPAAVPAASRVTAPATATPSRAWASLPPIQRTAGSMPLVAAPGRFAGALPGSQALPPIVRPLGHEVSSLATPGLVVARTRALEVSGPGSMPAPVQRRPSRGARQAPTEVVAPVAAPTAVAEPEHTEHVTHDAAPVATAPTAPIRTMPAVSRQSVRTPDRPLTSAASAALPAAVQRVAAAQAAAAAQSVASITTTQSASGGMRRVPSGMPVAKPTVSRQASTSHAEPSTPAVASPQAPSRSGLGEPMLTLPASARPVTSPGPVISRSTTSGPMPIAASSLRAPVHRSAGAAGPTPQLALGAGASAGTAAAAPAHLADLPYLRVARQSSGGTQASAAASAAVSVQTSAAPSGPVIRPIAGANPIRTSIAIQRDEADDVEDAGDDDAAMPSPWWGASDAPARASGKATPSSDALAPSIQRSSDAVAAFTGGPSAASSRQAGQAQVPSLGRSSVQRISSPAGRPGLPALPKPQGAGAASRTGSSPDSGGFSSQLPGSGVNSAPSVQTSLARTSAPLAAGITSQGPTVVQREGGNVAIHTQEPTPAAAGGAGPAAGAGPSGPVGPAGSGSSGRSEKDLDELAQALFGRIRGRLRSDLIYDREAKGLTFDNV